MNAFVMGFLCGAFVIGVAMVASLFAAVAWQKHVETFGREA